MKTESTFSGKFLFIFFLCIMLSINLSIGQKIPRTRDQKQPELRQGAYYTEEEGRRNLEHLKKQYPTLETWNKRAGLIKALILKGAGLDTLPKKKSFKRNQAQ